MACVLQRVYNCGQAMISSILCHSNLYIKNRNDFGLITKLCFYKEDEILKLSK